MAGRISVVIIVKNGGNVIGRVLDSLTSFNDIVVFDNGSMDNTEKVAKSYSNVNFVSGDFIGFGPTKIRASEFAKNDWILSLDADEVASKELIKSINSTALKKDTVYQIFRKNYYKDTHIKHCWNNDKIVRLYNRKCTNFNDNKVHENVISLGMNIVLLEGIVNHYPYRSISDFIQKLDVYSSQYAQGNFGKKRSSPLKAVLNSCFSFFKTYFIKRGFLDGYAGLVIAFSHMATNFYKYIKLYELNNK